MKARTGAAIVIIAGLIAGSAWFAWASRSDGEVALQTATIARGDIRVLISAAGSLTPKETVEVGAQVSGQLKSLLVEAGDAVEQGQLLAQIDATLAENKVEADRAQLKETQASYAQQAAQLELSQIQFDRAALLRSSDAISQADLDAAQAELKVARAKLQQLAAQIQRQNSTLKSDLAELDYTKIYAPMSGTVTSLSADEGQTLNANQSAPTILNIADLSVMTVEADVSEADVLRVKPGQSAYFTTLGDSKTEWRTTVRQILPEPEVVNDVVLYKALLDVENPDAILKSEMTAQVFFIVSEAEDVVLVPVSALQSAPPPPRGDAKGAPDRSARAGFGATEGDAMMVMVLESGSDKPRPRQVRIGIQTRAKAQVLSGLNPGDVVVTGHAGSGSAPAQKSTRDSGGPPGPPPGFRG